MHADNPAVMRTFVNFAVALATQVAGAQTLTLHYQERPPYSSARPDGGVDGLVATPAAAALQRAGIDFRWTLTPSQRQLALIQSGQGLHCGIGWFRSDERAARGRFSAPLYRDQPLGAIVREEFAPSAPVRVADWLADPRLRLLIKEGYSYGEVVDRLIAGAVAAPARTSVDPLQMGRMRRSGRADWMIVAPEEAAVLGGAGLRLVTFSDVPVGPARHLYCSTDVPSAWLARIDRALDGAMAAR